MSKLEVDQIDPQSGTTLTIGTSGDTIVIPSGVNLAAGAVLTAPVLEGTSSTAGSILFKEDTDNGTNSVTLKGPAATNDVTVTLPAATDTLVGKATTDTLTNKTINGSQLINATIPLNKLAAGTDGNIISFDNSGAVVAVATGNDGQVLTSAGAGQPPAFEAIPAVADNAITLAKMASGTDGNIISYDASGNPVAVATGSAGQILTSAGAGAPPTFAAAAAAGITVAEQWRINTSFNGDADPIASNWELNDSDSPGTIGGGVISQSSGIFSFDRTGLYSINFFTTQVGNGGDDLWINAQVQVSIDNGSNWSSPTENSSNIGNPGSGVMYTGTSQTALVDVSSISGGNTRKVRFIVQTANNGTTTQAYTSSTTTGVNFIRLGEAS